MSALSPEFRIEPFDGNPATARAVAAQHLDIRLRQRQDGENEFRTDIHDSQADLLGMQQYYVEPGGNFWIARAISASAVAGFVGLKRESEDIGRLKRMSVMPEHRGKRLGFHMATTLVKWATENDYKKIVLSTGKDELARPLIYDRLGFVQVGFDEEHEDYLMELTLAA